MTGWLMALWCIGFAVVNVVYELTGHFAGDRFTDHRTAITVANWLVVGLKTLGAVVALLSVAKRPRLLSPTGLAVLVWGAFATLTLYSVGSVVQAVGMVFGLAGSADQVDLLGIGYVLFFLLAAAGFGVLAISHRRRYALGRGVAVVGALGAPVVLGLLLWVVPTVLAAIGLLPAS
jgi:hypothetical protein